MVLRDVQEEAGVTKVSHNKWMEMLYEYMEFKRKLK